MLACGAEGLALLGWPGAGWYGRLPGMKAEPSAYRSLRFPAEIISHVVWLVQCFSLSLREVETILAQRGIVVSYESVGAWSLRFGRGRREQQMRRFKLARHAQQFLSSHQIHNLFQLGRHHLTPSITEPPVTVPSRPGVMSPALPVLPDRPCGMSNVGGKFARRRST